MAIEPAGVASPAVDSEHPPRIENAAVMRALAHPARLTILEHLGNDGPATATECAEVVGLSPSATSYHLRALAKVGLVEEAPRRGDARERLWRAVLQGYTIQWDPDAKPEVREAEMELINTFLIWEDAKTREYLSRIGQEPADWYDAAIFHEATLLVSADELREVNEALRLLFLRYRKRTRTDPPPGARTVSALFRAFPTDTLPTAG
jgi:DNA-binding transcriptional ArsR family regulator